MSPPTEWNFFRCFEIPDKQDSLAIEVMSLRFFGPRARHKMNLSFFNLVKGICIEGWLK